MIKEMQINDLIEEIHCDPIVQAFDLLLDRVYVSAAPIYVLTNLAGDEHNFERQYPVFNISDDLAIKQVYDHKTQTLIDKITKIQADYLSMQYGDVIKE